MLQLNYDIKFRKDFIHGILYLPDEEGQFPLVIRLNGFPGNSPEKEEQRLADIITQNNMAFYAFDYVGVRKSTGTFNYYTSLENINTVITDLSHHPRINPAKIALLGESFGGAMAISQGVRDQRIKCIVLRSPVYDTEVIPQIPSFNTLVKIWSRNNQIRFPKGDISELYYKQTNLYNPKKIANLVNCPVKLIAGDKDELLEVKGFRELYKCLPRKLRKGIDIIKGADHNFTKQKQFVELKSELSNFLTCCLLG
ncbi:MAG: alpha/beta hydrolase family protein [Candidatus Heimdallarchaeaceae archaeon]